jgi:hypothetical protein
MHEVLPEDQVVRLKKYGQLHPSVEITPPNEHSIMWRAYESGLFLTHHTQLDKRPDILERIT